MLDNRRKRIFEVIETSNGNDLLSTFYDYLMMVAIVVSLVPLAFKQDTPTLLVLDKITVSLFILDYILRLATADYKYKKKSCLAFVKYPFSAMAIVDLISILPSFTVVNSGVKLLRILRMIRAMRVLRVLRAMRYSKSLIIICNVLKKSKESLMAVGTLAVAYILISALIIFNVEPDSFNNFFDAVYWATVSLTTVGYGDIYPISSIGRIVTMVSSVFGIAIVALPAGIITAGYMQAIEESKNG